MNKKTQSGHCIYSLLKAQSLVQHFSLWKHLASTWTNITSIVCLKIKRPSWTKTRHRKWARPRSPKPSVARVWDRNQKMALMQLYFHWLPASTSVFWSKFIARTFEQSTSVCQQHLKHQHRINIKCHLPWQGHSTNGKIKKYLLQNKDNR